MRVIDFSRSIPGQAIQRKGKQTDKGAIFSLISINFGKAFTPKNDKNVLDSLPEKCGQE